MKKITMFTLVMLIVINLFGTVWEVYPNESIQDAINNAVNGDEIYVYNGVYTETLEIVNIELILQGESRNDCIIQATTSTTPSTENTIYANSWSNNLITIKDLTVRYGNIGIHSVNIPNCNLNIENVKSILNNYGIIINNTNSNITNCLINDNRYTGLHMNDSNLNIINSIIDGNGSTVYNEDYGAGIYLSTSNQLYLSNVTITNNYAYESGAGIMQALSDNSITFDKENLCTIENNISNGIGSDLYAYEHNGTVNVYTNSNPNSYPIDYWIINPVGIDETELQIVECYLCYNFPNPINEYTNIMFSNDTNLITSVEIYNCKGQLVDKFTTDSNTATLNTINYNSGIYFYKIKNKHMNKTQKMVIVK